MTCCSVTSSTSLRASRRRPASTSLLLAAFGTLHSAYAILAWPVPILMGFAFSAPIAGVRRLGAEGQLRWPRLFRFGIVPLFLFSGTFFPVTRLPEGLRQLAYATPLWHGVDLVRHLTLGTVTWGMALVHVAYLVDASPASASGSPSAATRRGSCDDDVRRHARASPLRTEPHGVSPLMADHLQRAVRTALLPRVARLRPRSLRRTRERRFVRELHRSRAARVVGDERRHLRRHDERLLEAALREGVRRGARDAARPDRRRARRDVVGAVPRDCCTRRASSSPPPRSASSIRGGACSRFRPRSSSASPSPAWASPRRRSFAAGRTSTWCSSCSCRCSCSARRSIR